MTAAQDIDDRPSRGSGRGSVATRVALAVLAGSLVPLLVLGVVTFNARSDQLRAAALDQLTALADVQQARVEAFITSAQNATRLVASRTQLRRSFADLLDGDAAATDRINRILIDARNSVEGLMRVSLLAEDGAVRASTATDRIGTSVTEIEQLDLTDPDATSLRVVDSDDPRLRVLVPALLDDRVLGAVAVELSLDPLVALATDHDGLGATGESLLAQRTPDGAASFITPLRFDPDAQLRRTVASSEVQVPVTVSLAQRETLLDDAVDYRGTAVFAATRYVSSADWGLVVKIDRAQALAPIQDLRRLLLIVGGLAVLLAVAVAIVLARSLTWPIARLETAVRTAQAGDLSVRADTGAPGEIGALGAAFNRMAAALARSTEQLEDEVAARTEELVQAVQELERRNEELDAFAGVVAHDLRTPLTTVMQVLEAVLHDMVAEGEVDEWLRRALRNANDMDDLIADLLTLARAGTIDIATDDVTLTEVVHEVVEDHDAHGLVRVDPLPTVVGDRRSLRQVFHNLIGNALKYVANEVVPRVIITSERVDDRWRVTVDDNGIGIPETERTDVFEPFTRGSEVATRPGTGVGLAIVRRVVERHGGQVVIDDSPLGGTRVSFTLPVAATDLVPPARDEPATNGS